MSIADKLVTIAENQSKVYDAGVKSEYDRFWDTYQQNGTRDRYRHAFAGDAWSDTGLLPPKYPIVLSAGITTQQGMFEDFAVWYPNKNTDQYDMTELCKMIDFSKCTYAKYMFQNAVAKNITCDFSGLIEMFGTFQGGDGGILNSITLKVTEKLTTVTSAFTHQTFLTDLTFTEDSVIACSGFNFQWSPLSKASITSVVNALSPTVTGKTVTFNKTAKESAFTADEWAALIATKSNWTFSLL